MNTKTSGARRGDVPAAIVADTSRPENPENGDLIVAPETASSARHGVRQLPGGVQLTAATKEEALKLARSFAKANKVNVWSESGEVVSLLETYR